MNIGRYFVLSLFAFGVAVGLAITRFPQLRAVPVPALRLPVALSFILDLVLMPLSRQGRVEPLTMEQRFIGVFGAAVIATGIVEFAK